VNGYLILGMYNLSIHKDAFFYLQYSQRISMIYFVFFTFISYEYLNEQIAQLDFKYS
jgi:hypothetical protein